jgi:hypothetical protein
VTPKVPIEAGVDGGERPFRNLLPIVDALVAHGNRVRPPGRPFYQDRDGWRCDLVAPIEFELIERLFELPSMIEVSRTWGTVLDRDTWIVIEGGLGE